MANSSQIRLLIVGFGLSEITFLNRLINGLAGQGFHITVATAHKKNLKNILSKNVHWLWAPRLDSPYFIYILRIVILALRGLFSKRWPWLIEQVLKQSRSESRLVSLYRYLPFLKGTWDVIYFPWNSAAVDYMGLYDLGLPVVVSCRGSQVNIRPHLSGQENFVPGLKESLTKARFVHCVSDDIKKQALEFGAEESKIHVIRPAVNTSFFTPSQESSASKHLRLITTGALIWRKGYEYLLLAVRHLLDKGLDVELSIIGDGKERNRVVYTLQDLHLSEQVKLPGRLSSEKIVSHLQKSDIFVFASLSEGIPNAVLEAMSCGLPIVTTDCGGIREVIQDGVEGFIVPVRNSQTMAEKIFTLAGDPALRMKMGKAARIRVQSMLDLSGQVEEFKSMFENSIS